MRFFGGGRDTYTHTPKGLSLTHSVKQMGCADDLQSKCGEDDWCPIGASGAVYFGVCQATRSEPGNLPGSDLHLTWTGGGEHLRCGDRGTPGRPGVVGAWEWLPNSVVSCETACSDSLQRACPWSGKARLCQVGAQGEAVTGCYSVDAPHDVLTSAEGGTSFLCEGGKWRFHTDSKGGRHVRCTDRSSSSDAPHPHVSRAPPREGKSATPKRVLVVGIVVVAAAVALYVLTRGEKGKTGVPFARGAARTDAYTYQPRP